MIELIRESLARAAAYIVLPTLSRRQPYTISLPADLEATHDLVEQHVGHLETYTLKLKEPTDKVIIFVLGNGRRIPDAFPVAAHLAKTAKANICLFHYRGVGESYGFPSSKKDLVHDTHIIINYWNYNGYSNDNITLYGHSLGGGIATKAAGNFAMEDKPRLIVDRTFGMISKVAAGMFAGLYAWAFWLAKTILEFLRWEIDIISDFLAHPFEKKLAFNLGRCGCTSGTDKKIHHSVDLFSELLLHCGQPIFHIHGVDTHEKETQHARHPAYMKVGANAAGLDAHIVDFSTKP